MLNQYTPNKSIAKKVLNDELNGVELYFIVYPLKGTKEKALSGIIKRDAGTLNSHLTHSVQLM